MLQLGENVSASAGDEVVRQGDPGDSIYVIAAGAFEVRKSGIEDAVLARREGMSFFGEMALVSDEPRVASVVCVTDGRLKKIPTSKFNELLAANDLTAYKVIVNIARMVAQRLSRLEKRVVGE